MTGVTSSGSGRRGGKAATITTPISSIAVPAQNIGTVWYCTPLVNAKPGALPCGMGAGGWVGMLAGTPQITPPVGA